MLWASTYSGDEHRLRPLALVSGIALGSAVLTGPAADAADTTVTFTVTPGALTITAPAGPVSLGSAAVQRTAFSHTAVAGVNNASWIPTLVLSIPFSGVSTGVYTGVITHSVA